MKRTLFILAALWVLASAAGEEAVMADSGGSAATTASVIWEPVLDERFDSAASLQHWVLEGAAEAAVTKDGRLEVRNRREKIGGELSQASVIWHRTPFWGDIRIEFACQAEPASRVILFFNARADSSQRDIFAWERPASLYGNYAYEPRLDLYSLGLLRSDQDSLNLRRLGGAMPRSWIERMPFPPGINPQRWLSVDELAQALKSVGRIALPDEPREIAGLTSKGEFPRLLAPYIERFKAIDRSFQQASIVASATTQRPVFADSARQYRVAVEVVDNRVQAWVEGQLILDITDTTRPGGALRGGYFGFRNFRATAAWFDDVRVYQKGSL